MDLQRSTAPLQSQAMHSASVRVFFALTIGMRRAMCVLARRHCDVVQDRTDAMADASPVRLAHGAVTTATMRARVLRARRRRAERTTRALAQRVRASARWRARRATSCSAATAHGACSSCAAACGCTWL
jgi:hypothetical protein